MKKNLYILVVVLLMATNMQAQHEIGVVAGGFNGVTYRYWLSNYFAVQTDLGVGVFLPNSEGAVYDFTLNPHLVTQVAIGNVTSFYVGGGTNLGIISEIDNTDPQEIMGKWGLDALIGFEYRLKTMPLVFALDFRPGYLIAFQSLKDSHYGLFDWKLAIAVRYCL